MESGALTEMGSATTPQAAIGIVARSGSRESRTIPGGENASYNRNTYHKKTYCTHLHAESSVDMTRALGKVSYGNSLVGFKSRLNDGWSLLVKQALISRDAEVSEILTAA